MEVKRLSLDIISSLPSTIIETILCLVPIRDAVRTSILSRSWRYKWVGIPKLMFGAKDMFDKSNDEPQLVQSSNERKQFTEKCSYAICQVLLLHQGPILEFLLSMEADDRCFGIDQIILYLSQKNTVKKLTLDLRHGSPYKLPVSVFSLHQLTELTLDNCTLDLDPAFSTLGSLTSLSLTNVIVVRGTFPHLNLNPTLSGFGSLTSLSLVNVNIYEETFLRLISTDGLLINDLSLMLWDGEIEEVPLYLDIIELFKFLYVIEHLSIWCWSFEDLKYYAQDTVPRELPTTLVHLKSLRVFDMRFAYKCQIFALFILIRSSPNLKKIRLEQEIEDNAMYRAKPEINSFADYSDIWLEHLNELEIEHFTNLKVELEFVKLILAKSPILKKVRIQLSKRVENDEELKMLRILIRCQRASPIAEIIVERP